MFDPDSPSIELHLPEDGSDAVLLFEKSDMFEDEDGLLTLCAYLCPGMALEIGKRLIAWSVAMEDEVEEEEEDD